MPEWIRNESQKVLETRSRLTKASVNRMIGPNLGLLNVKVFLVPEELVKSTVLKSPNA